jgi:hypothetical protein
MLRQTDYMKMADDYSTSIGMATYVQFEATDDIIKKRKGDDLVINEIIALSIESGIYQQLIRKVYELQKGRRGKIKDSTIYKRAHQLICK